MTVDEYIDNLPEDRRIAIRAVREAVNAKLPPGYEEGIVYGMIAWFVPFTRLAETYNGQPLCVASLGAQKSHMALYLQSVYSDPSLNEWFQKTWKTTGKKLDMGKSCIRFKKLDELALDVIGEAIARVSVDQYVTQYEAIRANTAEGKQKAAAAVKEAVSKAEAKAKDVVGKAGAKAKQTAATAKSKGTVVVAKAEGTARATAAKAKEKGQAVMSRAKAAVGKAKDAVVGKAKAAAGKAAGKAKAAVVGKAKAAAGKAASSAKAAAKQRIAAGAARGKGGGKKPSSARA